MDRFGPMPVAANRLAALRSREWCSVWESLDYALRELATSGVVAGNRILQLAVKIFF